MNLTAEDSGKAPTPVFDRVAAVTHLGDDESMLCELATMFLDRIEHSVGVIRSAVIDRDGWSLHYAAHWLEGSLATFFAAPSIEAVCDLARMGKNGNWQEAAEQFRRLEGELDLLTAALRQLTEDDSQ